MEEISVVSSDYQTTHKVYLIWQRHLQSPHVSEQDKATLPACLLARVFAHIHMTFEITQLQRQITGSSPQEPEISPLRQMFTSEPGTPRRFLSCLTTRAVKQVHLCF